MSGRGNPTHLKRVIELVREYPGYDVLRLKYIALGGQLDAAGNPKDWDLWERMVFTDNIHKRLSEGIKVSRLKRGPPRKGLETQNEAYYPIDYWTGQPRPHDAPHRSVSEEREEQQKREKTRKTAALRLAEMKDKLK